MRYQTFCSLGNFELILRQTAVVGTGALGMTLIIIAGGIDLSAGSMVSVVTVAIGLLLPHLVVDPMSGERHISAGLSPWIAALAGIGVAAICGLINGTLITQLRLAPFIVTLGTMSALRGASEGLAHQTMVYPSDTILNRLLEPINQRDLWLLTPGVWMMLALAVLVSAMLRYTRFGRHVFAIGSNEQTARLCGVRVERATILIYVIGAALTGVAGLLHFSYLTMGDPTTAFGMELDIIAAVVIGGASLNGGQGTILGSLVGALIMTVIADGCNKMDWQPWVQKIVTGAIIIFAVALDRLRHRQEA
jgi:ribose/xylose/arabinose/galactoside ABC-type transport system permease subunit